MVNGRLPRRASDRLAGARRDLVRLVDAGSVAPKDRSTNARGAGVL